MGAEQFDRHMMSREDLVENPIAYSTNTIMFTLAYIIQELVIGPGILDYDTQIYNVES